MTSQITETVLDLFAYISVPLRHHFFSTKSTSFFHWLECWSTNLLADLILIRPRKMRSFTPKLRSPPRWIHFYRRTTTNNSLCCTRQDKFLCSIINYVDFVILFLGMSCLRPVPNTLCTSFFFFFFLIKKGVWCCVC